MLEAQTKEASRGTSSDRFGRTESQISVRNSDGQIVDERRWPTANLGRYLAARPKSLVVVETCSEAFAAADAVLAVGYEVRVVPATRPGS